MAATLRTLDRYARHRRATAQWLVRSIEHGRGGSCAHFSLAGGWSAPYPETTGYLIPTLLALDGELAELQLARRARDLGRWLLSIQNGDGSWNGGLHEPRCASKPSVFNTGQILKGLVALHRADPSAGWLESAHRGAAWLQRRSLAQGLWPAEYRASATPSYYTHVAWPMLEVATETGDAAVRRCAEHALARILLRRRENGAFESWGFGEDGRAFTHTIAYTLRGILECSRLLEAWEDIGARAVPALERVVRKAELSGGRLAGEIDLEWRASGEFVCLTGNAQLAICLLIWEQHERDLRLVNAAAKLVDRVCAAQSLSHPLGGLRGAVAGSAPVWGRYMALRYPNWAAKYHCDALVRLAARVEAERERAACACS